MDIEQCSICLEKYRSTVSVEEIDECNVKWFTKLQFVAPELEWLEEYIICESCKKHLEQAWEFKKLVLNLEVDRRLGLTKKETYPVEENSDFKDTCDSEYYYEEEKGVVCNICSKSFTTQTQLLQHKLQIHTEDGLGTDTKNEDNSTTKNAGIVFSCYDCGKDFRTKEDLLWHIENDHCQFKLCLICDKLCSNKAISQKHMNDENKFEISKEFACCICLQKFESETKLNEHTPLCTKFHCGKCQQGYSTKKLLNAHLKSCENRERTTHQCTCKNFYTTERNLNLHKIWCAKEKEQEANQDVILNYTCSICTIEFNSVEEYNSHILKHNSQKIGESPPSKVKARRGRKPLKKFSCENCSEQFDYVKLVVEHCVSVHGMNEKNVKPYSCDKCEMHFASSANLDQHRNYHERNRTHICSLCGKGFITKSDLTVHEYTHYNRRNYKCSQCDKAFNTNKNLRTHNLVVHTDRSLWKYGCNICEKRFPLKTNYDQHLRRHTGDKKYVCHICRKPFISKSEMQRHINLHSNIKAFKCSHCDKEYKERRTYQAHLAKIHGIGKVHVREKKFVCHICPSQFYDEQKLSRHLCSHSGLKPFPCHACEKKFTDKSYLKHHLKIAHNILGPLNVELMG